MNCKRDTNFQNICFKFANSEKNYDAIIFFQKQLKKISLWYLHKTKLIIIIITFSTCLNWFWCKIILNYLLDIEQNKHSPETTEKQKKFSKKKTSTSKLSFSDWVFLRVFICWGVEFSFYFENAKNRCEKLQR